MFYPKLQRRDNYLVKKGGGYYTYSSYYKEVLEDCLNRCVYCDITLEELGYEGVHLDHFRPQDYFKSLINDPNNLVIACPKCNRLKSNHWPVCKIDSSKPSHDGMVGFLDPFQDDISYYLSVSTNGVLDGLNKPADYFIELLDLNRNARVLSRFRRYQIARINELYPLVKVKILELVDDLINQKIEKDDAIKKKQVLELALDFIQGQLQLMK